jgi:hypothetical protein
VTRTDDGAVSNRDWTHGIHGVRQSRLCTTPVVGKPMQKAYGRQGFAGQKAARVAAASGITDPPRDFRR